MGLLGFRHMGHDREFAAKLGRGVWLSWAAECAVFVLKDAVSCLKY